MELTLRENISVIFEMVLIWSFISHFLHNPFQDYFVKFATPINAWMAEQVDAHDSNSCTERCVGSIPTSGTIKSTHSSVANGFLFISVSW